jgi:hypothetical protein
MSQAKVYAGGLGVSRIKESTYGAGSGAISHFIQTNGVGPTRDKDRYTSRGEARGVEETSEQIEIMDRTSVEIPDGQELTDIALLHHMIYGLGSDVKTTPSAATNARQHALTLAGVNTPINSTWMQANTYDLSSAAAGDKYRNMLFKGCVANRFNMRGSVDTGYLQYGSAWQADGATPATPVDISGLSIPKYGPYKMNNQFLYVGSAVSPGSLVLPTSGATPTGGELTGAVNLSTKLLGFGYGYNNDLDVEGGHAGTLGLNATEMERTERLQTLSLDLKYDPAVAFIDELSWNQIATALQTASGVRSCSLALYNWSNFALDTSGTIYTHAWTSLFPVCWLTKVTKTQRKGRWVISAEFEIGTNLTQQSIYFYTWNLEANQWAHTS